MPSPRQRKIIATTACIRPADLPNSKRGIYCGAVPGEPCRHSGEPITGLHLGRERLYAQAHPRGGAGRGQGRKVSPEGRRNRVTVWLSDDVHRALQRQAATRGVDVPTAAREWIEERARG